jgi:hypothetical protein
VDYQTRCDEQQSPAASLPKKHESACSRCALPGSTVVTPTSLTRRCNHIIALIDELLPAPVSCFNIADGRNELGCRESSRTEPGARGVGAGGDYAAS